MTRIRAADADGLSPHIVRAHLDALLGRECIGQCSCALPVEIVTGDDRLRFRGFLQHLLVEIHIHMDIVSRYVGSLILRRRSGRDTAAHTGEYGSGHHHMPSVS